jgi:hypothetical protein
VDGNLRNVSKVHIQIVCDDLCWSQIDKATFVDVKKYWEMLQNLQGNV